MRTCAMAMLVAVITSGLAGQHRYDPVAGSAGGVWLREGGDPWAALGAPPLLAMIRGPGAGVAGFPAPWGVGELSGSAAVIAMPLGPGGIGATVTRFGFDLCSETAFGVVYGARSGGALLFGAALRWTHLAIARYGSAGYPSVDAAVVVATGSSFRWGLRITDLNRPAVGETGSRLRESAGIAAAFSLPGNTRICAEAGRDDTGLFSVRTGVSYEGDPLSARFGTSGSFDRIHCGIGLSPGPVGFGYGVVIHPELGWSHSVWLNFEAAQ